MHYLRDEVVVLRKIPYREYDRRYIMYGQRHGLLIAVARGSLKIRAKQSGQLEPLTVAQVMIAKGRNYDHLAVAVHSHPEIILKSLGALAAAGSLADLYLKLIKPGVADKRLFDLWLDYLECLSELPHDATLLRSELLFAAASLKMMDSLGYGPGLRHCSICHQVLGPTDAWYASDLNGLICDVCIKNWSADKFRAKAHSITLLRYMRQNSFKEIARISLSVDVAQNALSIIQEIWQHAPLDKKPHGMETMAKLMAV